MGENRHGSASSDIAKPVTGGTGGTRNDLGGQCNGSDGTHNSSTSRGGNVGTDSSSRANFVWRDNRGGSRGRGGTRGAAAAAV